MLDLIEPLSRFKSMDNNGGVCENRTLRLSERR